MRLTWQDQVGFGSCRLFVLCSLLNSLIFNSSDWVVSSGRKVKDILMTSTTIHSPPVWSEYGRRLCCPKWIRSRSVDVCTWQRLLVYSWLFLIDWCVLTYVVLIWYIFFRRTDTYSSAGSRGLCFLWLFTSLISVFVVNLVKCCIIITESSSTTSHTTLCSSLLHFLLIWYSEVTTLTFIWRGRFFREHIHRYLD